jgi:hypothetical protein
LNEQALELHLRLLEIAFRNGNQEQAHQVVVRFFREESPDPDSVGLDTHLTEILPQRLCSILGHRLEIETVAQLLKTSRLQLESQAQIGSAYMGLIDRTLEIFGFGKGRIA